MNQAVLVGVMQRLAHGRHQFHRLVQRQPGLLEPRGQVGSVDVLGDDKAGGFQGTAHVVDRHDVRVVEIGDRPRFAQVGDDIFELLHLLAMRHLDRHESLQLVIESQIDEAKAPFAQEPLNPVTTDLVGYGPDGALRAGT
jgi:hypothetical protein